MPDPHLYTGHCFRRSGATILADTGADTLTVKQFGGWKSTTVMESYVEQSLARKEEIGKTILNSVQPSTSGIQDSQPSGSRTTKIVSTNHQKMELEQSGSSGTTYTGCSFHNCNFIFNKPN